MLRPKHSQPIDIPMPRFYLLHYQFPQRRLEVPVQTSSSPSFISSFLHMLHSEQYVLRHHHYSIEHTRGAATCPQYSIALHTLWANGMQNFQQFPPYIHSVSRTIEFLRSIDASFFSRSAPVRTTLLFINLPANATFPIACCTMRQYFMSRLI